MSHAITVQKNSLSIANDENKIQLIKDVFFKNATDDELKLFIHACDRTGLDPFMKQIHPVKRWDSTLRRETMSIQTGIDGYRLIAERTGCYTPGRDPVFEYNKDGKLLKATSFVKKLTKDGTWHEISAPAFFDEYCQRTKDGSPTSMWQKMPHSQLAKCAEALALRKAFPAELSGVYTKEEMEQSEVVDVKAAVAEVAPPLSAHQLVELRDIYDECEPGYLEKILAHFKVKALDQLSSKEFERLKNAAIHNRNKHRETVKTEEPIEEEEKEGW